MTARHSEENSPSDSSHLLYRHTLPVRVMHWINAVCMLLLLMSGLQIFNAHPALYWGEASHFETPLLSLDAKPSDAGLRGVTNVLGKEFDTTGFLGVSRTSGGDPRQRGFPAWLTIPGWQALATGRRWHFFFGWLFVLNGIAFVLYSIASRHVTRDLAPTRRDWRGIGKSIVDHALLRQPHGAAAARYNVLQKLSYLLVVFVFGPLIVLLGLAMSPHMDSVLGWLLDFIGGRQSARTLHFLVALAFVVFFAVHIFEVVVTGAYNNIRSMITGRYRIEREEDQ